MELDGAVRSNTKEGNGERARLTLTTSPSENGPNGPAPFGDSNE